MLLEVKNAILMQNSVTKIIFIVASMSTIIILVERYRISG
jgi:hypothetical protein